MAPPTPKQLLRLEMRVRLASIDAAAVLRASHHACARLLGLSAFAAAERVMLYMPLGHELSPAPLAFEGQRLAKTLWLPRTDWESRAMSAAKAPPWNADGVNEGLVAGRHELREPPPAAEIAEPATLDMILIPGLAFDARGGRLGRGAGFYDRFLADLRRASGKAVFVALALDEQILEGVPMDRHDVYVDLVVTPTRTLGPRAETTGITEITEIT